MAKASEALGLEMAPTLPGKSKQPPNVCSFMFPVQERASEPRCVWNYLGSCGDTPYASTWIPGLGSKIHNFLSGVPRAARQATA